MQLSSDGVIQQLLQKIIQLEKNIFKYTSILQDVSYQKNYIDSHYSIVFQKIIENYQNYINDINDKYNKESNSYYLHYFQILYQQTKEFSKLLDDEKENFNTKYKNIQLKLSDFNLTAQQCTHNVETAMNALNIQLKNIQNTIYNEIKTLDINLVQKKKEYSIDTQNKINILQEKANKTIKLLTEMHVNKQTKIQKDFYKNLFNDINSPLKKQNIKSLSDKIKALKNQIIVMRQSVNLLIDAQHSHTENTVYEFNNFSKNISKKIETANEILEKMNNGESYDIQNAVKNSKIYIQLDENLKRIIFDLNLKNKAFIDDKINQINDLEINLIDIRKRNKNILDEKTISINKKIDQETEFLKEMNDFNFDKILKLKNEINKEETIILNHLKQVQTKIDQEKKFFLNENETKEDDFIIKVDNLKKAFENEFDEENNIFDQKCKELKKIEEEIKKKISDSESLLSNVKFELDNLLAKFRNCQHLKVNQKLEESQKSMMKENFHPNENEEDFIDMKENERKKQVRSEINKNYEFENKDKVEINSKSNETTQIKEKPSGNNIEKNIYENKGYTKSSIETFKIEKNKTKDDKKEPDKIQKDTNICDLNKKKTYQNDRVEYYEKDDNEISEKEKEEIIKFRKQSKLIIEDIKRVQNQEFESKKIECDKQLSDLSIRYKEKEEFFFLQTDQNNKQSLKNMKMILSSNNNEFKIKEKEYKSVLESEEKKLDEIIKDQIFIQKATFANSNQLIERNDRLIESLKHKCFQAKKNISFQKISFEYKWKEKIEDENKKINDLKAVLPKEVKEFIRIQSEIEKAKQFKNEDENELHKTLNDLKMQGNNLLIEIQYDERMKEASQNDKFIEYSSILNNLKHYSEIQINEKLNIFTQQIYKLNEKINERKSFYECEINNIQKNIELLKCEIDEFTKNTKEKSSSIQNNNIIKIQKEKDDFMMKKLYQNVSFEDNRVRLSNFVATYQKEIKDEEMNHFLKINKIISQNTVLIDELSKSNRDSLDELKSQLKAIKEIANKQIHISHQQLNKMIEQFKKNSSRDNDIILIRRLEKKFSNINTRLNILLKDYYSTKSYIEAKDKEYNRRLGFKPDIGILRGKPLLVRNALV